MRQLYWIVGAVAVLLLVSLLSSSTAYTTDMENVTSNVTVNKQLAIGLSAQLSNGIQFGSLEPNTANNADPDNANNAVSADSGNNVNIDLCVKVNANLSRTAASTIGLLNYTWWDNSSAGLTNNETTINASYQKGFNSNIGAGAASYWGFWLDIPSGQTAGTYNNTVHFAAVETGQTCT